LVINSVIFALNASSAGKLDLLGFSAILSLKQAGLLVEGMPKPVKLTR